MIDMFDAALAVEVIKPGMEGYTEECAKQGCPGCAKLWVHYRDGRSDLLMQYLGTEKEVQLNPLTASQLQQYFLRPEEYETIEEHREGKLKRHGLAKLISDVTTGLKGGQDCGHN